jgi:hypothetical protein
LILQNPYSISFQDGDFVFETDLSLSYKITFQKHTAFENLGYSSFEFGFYPIHDATSSYDSRIEDTIVFAIREFFEQNPDAILLYICDSSDGKARQRNILFGRWYNKYGNDSIKRLNRKIFDTENDLVYYFAVIFDNRYIQSTILESFIELEEDNYNK